VEVDGLQIGDRCLAVGEDLPDVGQRRRRAAGEERRDGENAGGEEG
jgi:hypothetical protein